MWHRFTEGARRAVWYAQQEAERMGTKDIASEHLLIGLIRQVQEEQGRVWPPAPTGRAEGADAASRILSELGLDLEEARAEVVRQGPRAARAGGDFQLMPDAMQVFDLTSKEARQSPPHTSGRDTSAQSICCSA